MIDRVHRDTSTSGHRKAEVDRIALLKTGLASSQENAGDGANTALGGSVRPRGRPTPELL